MGLPDPDMDTTQRLLAMAMSSPKDVPETSASILAAIVSFLVGTMGAEQAASILRNWADAIEDTDWPTGPRALS